MIGKVVHTGALLLTVNCGGLDDSRAIDYWIKNLCKESTQVKTEVVCYEFFSSNRVTDLINKSGKCDIIINDEVEDKCTLVYNIV